MSVHDTKESTNGDGVRQPEHAPPDQRRAAVKPQDPFDPTRFRVAQNYVDLVGGKKLITHVPVGRPNKQSWFQVSADPAFTLDVNVLDVKTDNEVYLVDPLLALELPHEVVAKRLHTYVTKQGDLGIWAIKLPDSEGKIDGWNASAMVAVEAANEKWVRLISNRTLGCYEVMTAAAELGEPNFGDKPFSDLLEIAFRGKIIESADHPLLRRLRGEV